MVATPYASGLSALVDDETELGVACVDLGGGTTTISVFMDGQFVHADAIAIGGQHVTTDIARGLSTRIEDAERLKTMHGSALPSVSDERDMLSVLPISDDDRDVPNQIPRAALTRIIRARIEEVLELVRDRLEPLRLPDHGRPPDRAHRRRQPARGHQRGGAAHPGAQCAPRPPARDHWPCRRRRRGRPSRQRWVC